MSKKINKCDICRKVPKPSCDWRQGRCPHLTPTIYHLRFYNLINAIKQLFKGKK